MVRDRRLVVTVLLIAALSAAFWAGSRYPDLDRKAAVGGDIPVSGLGFDVVVPTSPSDPPAKRIVATTLNWADTNKKGMAFGLLIASAILTLLSVLTRRSVRHPLGNSLLGILVGAPLGLCVNCAAPIAKGMHRGGTRLETTLTMLFSSPSMNFIVLTMLLALLPWYLWFTKILASGLFLVLGIPLLCRIVFRRETEATVQDEATPRESADDSLFDRLVAVPAIENPGWWGSVGWTTRAFATHLWWLTRTTVPLMLLAGALGSVLITVLPWGAIEGFSVGGGPLPTIFAMGLLALVATFLPVPMAFDVVICAILFERGMPAHYVMVLLFTLGSFSVFPFMILSRAVSLRVASGLYVATCCVGVVSGIFTYLLEEWHLGRQETLLVQTLFQEEPAVRPPSPPTPTPLVGGQLDAALPRPIQAMPWDLEENTGIQVLRHAFRASGAEGGETHFSRHDGPEYGLDVPTYFSPNKFLLRSPEKNRPVASGDVHGDGWPDLLIGADHDIGGLSLFANVAGERFVRQRVDLGALSDAMIQNAALVDLDDDGWLDIFFSTYTQGNFVAVNRAGRFVDEPVLLSRDEATLANAAAFADLDRDGDLDIVLGNWTQGYKVTQGTPRAAENRILISQGGTRYSVEGLEGQPGHTLSALLTDLDADGLVDLVIGNEFELDRFYLGRGDGGLRELTRSDAPLLVSAWNTMSVTSADIDNDLRAELFSAQIAIGTERESALERRIPPLDALAEVAGARDRDELRRALTWWPLVDRIRRSEDLGAVAGVDDAWMRQQFSCFGLVLISTRRVSTEWAELLPDECRYASDYLSRAFSPRYVPTSEELARAIPESANGPHNVLLTLDDQGRFVERAEAMNLGVTDWTWNARFADTDNDGWQDLYAANGWLRQTGWESNVYLRNVNGQTFRNDTESSGLSDHLPTSAYTYVDFDRDGDLDIVSVPILGPVRVFVNHTDGVNAIQIQLVDDIGNSHGIGSKIVIHYGVDGRLHQMRELQASGGFVSYDEAVAHFGLGAHHEVDRIEIQWSTGESTILDRTFPAGHRYTVERRAEGATSSGAPANEAGRN